MCPSIKPDRKVNRGDNSDGVHWLPELSLWRRGFKCDVINDSFELGEFSEMSLCICLNTRMVTNNVASHIEYTNR